jgi:hypothetical protein
MGQRDMRSCIGKSDAARGQCIEYGRARGLVAVGTKTVGTKGVNRNEKDTLGLQTPDSGLRGRLQPRGSGLRETPGAACSGPEQREGGKKCQRACQGT